MFIATLQVLLAGVFAVAAVGKLFDLDGTRRALLDFGVPSRLADAGRVALPVLELVVAVCVLLQPAALFGALLAGALLVAFCAAITRSLRAGRTPDCHCFGSLHSEPTGPETLMRNAVLLMAAATLAVVGVDRGPAQAIGDATVTALALAGMSLLCLVLATSCVSLWREVRRVRATVAPAAPEGLPVGSSAPDFAGAGAGGEEVTLADLLARARPVVLVLVHPGCGPCRQLIPRLVRWAPSLESTLTLVVISAGEFAVTDAEDLLLLTVDGYEVAASFNTLTTPAAILLDTGGVVRTRPALGALAIEELVRSTLGKRARNQTPMLAVEDA